MLAHKRRHLSIQDIADRATVTRQDVSKVEQSESLFPPFILPHFFTTCSVLVQYFFSRTLNKY